MARVALVTGGTRGLGAAIARDLKAVGNTVVVCDVVEEQIAKFKADTGIAGFKIDVGDFASVEAGVKEIESTVGPIDVVVNNAGITRDGFLHKMDPVKQWQAVINVNLGSVFNTCRCIVPGMRERGWGRIINISSMNGQRGQFGQVNYSSAKAGMLGFTRALAQEVAGKGVTVNAVCPGFILTEMTGAMPKEVLEAEVKKIPLGRIGLPDDIGYMVAFLASDQASFITGATMSVNGGQYMAS
ncbi:MAG: acetoacetyl-CoA reductase [Rhodospirillaceae bacterium]|nr:MAG: acetoacetyl-CoA reductase [Rhodospirillaceae bacterium]